jgi:hypothetical protein
MLDCHIIVSDDTPKDWVMQCLDSVYEAADRASFPVVVHTVNGVSGHIGRARAAAYSLGSQPYVTCVDDDDYVLPHAFSQMSDALHSGVSAVCTPEQTLQNVHLSPGAPRHHLIAYRRELLIDHTQWPSCGDVAQMHVIGADAVNMPSPAYVHRLYMDSKARVMRRANLDELRSASHG